MPITILHALFALLLLLPFGGLMARGWQASFHTSTETIDSPRASTKWTYRGLIFSLYALVSFLTTPAIFSALNIPLLSMMKSSGALYLLFCVPVAALLFRLDCAYMRWCDTAKLAARKRLASQQRAQQLGESRRER